MWKLLHRGINVSVRKKAPPGQFKGRSNEIVSLPISYVEFIYELCFGLWRDTEVAFIIVSHFDTGWGENARQGNYKIIFFFFFFNFYIQEQLSYIPAHSTHAFVLKEN